MDSRAADRNVLLLYAYWGLREFQLWIPVWVVFLTLEQGFTLTAVTSVEGLYLVGIVLLEVPTGAVADRYGRSRSLALGAFTLGIAVLLFAFATNIPILVVSFLLWSVAHTLMSGADMALLFDTLKLKSDEAAFERIAGRGAALSWAGAGVATFLGGPVAALTDIQFTIYLGAATCVVTGFIALAMKEPPHSRGESTEHYWAGIAGAFRQTWRTLDLRWVILLSGAGFAAIEAVQYLVQPYLLDRGVEVGFWFSALQVPMIFAGAGGALVAGFVGGRAGAIVALITIPVGGVGAYLALAAVPGLWAYAAIPALFALASCMEPITTGYVNRRISSENRATILSMQGMVGSLTLAALAPAAGFITDEWGLVAAFAAGAASTAAAIALFGLPLIGKKEPPSAPPVVVAAPGQ